MIELPWDTLEFRDSWTEWLEYKHQEFRFKYKSPISMKKALKKLERLSGGNEQTAIAIIDESIANGWKGFFRLKDEPNKKLNAGEIILKQYGLDRFQ